MRRREYGNTEFCNGTANVSAASGRHWQHSTALKSTGNFVLRLHRSGLGQAAWLAGPSLRHDFKFKPSRHAKGRITGAPASMAASQTWAVLLPAPDACSVARTHRSWRDTRHGPGTARNPRPADIERPSRAGPALDESRLRAEATWIQVDHPARRGEAGRRGAGGR